MENELFIIQTQMAMNIQQVQINLDMTHNLLNFSYTHEPLYRRYFILSFSFQRVVDGDLGSILTQIQEVREIWN